MPLLVLLAAFLFAAPAREAPHNIHLTYGRMAVEGKTAVCQIKYFKHDLEEALGRHHKRPGVRLAVDAASDSLYLGYFNEAFVFRGDGERLRGEIVSSGEEGDMWWYTLRFEAGAPIQSYELKNALLFEVFSDQKNIFKVMHFPSEETHAFYFVQGAETYEASFAAR